MPRSRNIKPSFFTNDELAEIDPIGRLLFIGLWTIADYKGELEWRPKKIKAQLLPYDNCSIEKIAINLDKSGFIRFYSNGDKNYVNIPNFDKHQNPHKNEKDKGSDIPRFEDCQSETREIEPSEKNHDKSRLNRESNGTDPADSCFLIPDSCSLIPDCGLPDSGRKPKSKTRSSLDFSAWPQTPTPQILADYKKLRQSKKAPLTQTVINRMAKELTELNFKGISVDQALGVACEKGWQGLKADWVVNHLNSQPLKSKQFSTTTAHNIEVLRDLELD